MSKSRTIKKWQASEIAWLLVLAFLRRDKLSKSLEEAEFPTRSTALRGCRALRSDPRNRPKGIGQGADVAAHAGEYNRVGCLGLARALG